MAPKLLPSGKVSKKLRLPEKAKGKTGKELAEATLRFIKAHPDMHDQSVWAYNGENVKNACGTTCCFAGWAVCLHYGRVPKTLFDWDDVWDPNQAEKIKNNGTIQNTAAELLGLSPGTKLFASWCSLNDLKSAVASDEYGRW